MLFDWVQIADDVAVADVVSVAGVERKAFLVKNRETEDYSVCIFQDLALIADARKINEYAIGSDPQTKANCYLRFVGYKPR